MSLPKKSPVIVSTSTSLFGSFLGYMLPLCCMDSHTFLPNILSGTIQLFFVSMSHKYSVSFLDYFWVYTPFFIFCVDCQSFFALLSKWALNLSFLVFSFLVNITKLLVETSLEKFDLSVSISAVYLGKKIAIITLRNNNFQCSRLKITFLWQVFVKLISVWICIVKRREWAGNFSEIFRNTEQLVTINRLNKVLNTVDLMWYVIFFSWFSQNLIVPINGYFSCALSCYNIHVACYNVVI